MHLDLPKTSSKELAKSFQGARPFSFITFDKLLSDPTSIASAFPGASWEHWTPLGDEYQRNKFGCSDLAVIPEPISSLIVQLSTPTFLEFLEQITGIPGLIPDPYLKGGGLHLSTGGGILGLHTDFHYYKELHLFRRLNLIIYLNEQWGSSDGGELELHHQSDQQQKVSIEPLLGRTVIFQTDDKSIHGFMNPVAHGRERRSIALYYYTSVETETFSGDEATYWRGSLGAKGANRIRFQLFRFLMMVSRSLSIIAHMINPHQGIKLLRARLKK